MSEMGVTGSRSSGCTMGSFSHKFSARHYCPHCAIKKADQNLLPWTEGNEHVKAAVSRLLVYVRPGCENGCTCTHKDCAKNLISRLHDEFPAVDHLGVSAEDMKHMMHAEIGDFAQNNLIGQVRSPQLIAEKLDWLEQFYYAVFHCDKKYFANMLWSVTVDIYGLLIGIVVPGGPVVPGEPVVPGGAVANRKVHSPVSVVQALHLSIHGS